MRLIALIFLIITLGALTARADTLVVTGVLLETNGSRAAGYTVKIYVIKPNLGVSYDDTSSNGIYTIVKENVEASTRGSWYVVCERGSKKASAQLVFTQKPNNIWQAKVEDLTLRSSDQARYSPNEAVETIRTITTIQSIKAKSGEQTLEAANEQAEREVAHILGRTDLGQSPDTTLRQINQAVTQTSDTNLPKLTLMSADKFVRLRNRPEFTKLAPDKPNALFRVTERNNDDRARYLRRNSIGEFDSLGQEDTDSISFVEDYLKRISAKRPFGFTVINKNAPDSHLVALVVTDQLKKEDILDWLNKSPSAYLWAFYSTRLLRQNLTDDAKAATLDFIEKFKTHYFDLSTLPVRP